MRLFKIPSFAPVPDDTAELKRRVRELETVVDKYRTKRVGPYDLTVQISGPNWSGIVSYLNHAAETAEKYGPDAMSSSWGSSGGYSGHQTIKSNMSGGPGETASDVDAEDVTPPANQDF